MNQVSRVGDAVVASDDLDGVLLHAPAEGTLRLADARNDEPAMVVGYLWKDGLLSSASGGGKPRA